MNKPINIQFITFKAGSLPGQPGLSLTPSPITIIIGPNNSGKSQTLKEIESWCRGETPDKLLLKRLSCSLPKSFEEAMEMLKPIIASPPPGHPINQDHTYIYRAPIRSGENTMSSYVNHEELKSYLKEGNSRPNIYHYFVRFFTLRLDGRTRFDLIADKPTGLLETPPQNLLWALFVDEESTEKIRQFTEEAFGKYFVIDPTGMQQFRIRLSNRNPAGIIESQSIGKEAREFYQKTVPIAQCGDGICASVGLACAVMSFSRILLIDEPEAFLHPTLAHKVGNFLSKTAREKNASLIIATHSPDFLMGCLKNSSEICIVRLTNFKDQPTARSIAPEKINDLIKDPLIRSSNTLKAFFHHSVIVTESDSDRAFYEEVNYRLLQCGRGVTDCFFINAQNWQTIPRIIAPLREAGIPAAAIFDFDVLFHDDFNKISRFFLDDKAFLENKRNTLLGKLKPLSEEIEKTLKEKGIKAFDLELQRDILAFLAEIANYGIFIVPIGALEQWLSKLHDKKISKKNWLPDMFERMGSDSQSDDYVFPDNDDVWNFIDKINEWITNPNRLGIPS